MSKAPKNLMKRLKAEGKLYKSYHVINPSCERAIQSNSYIDSKYSDTILGDARRRVGKMHGEV